MPAAKNLTLNLNHNHTPPTTEMELLSPSSIGKASMNDVPSILDEEVQPERNKMKKELGLLEGVAIILGIIFGSGLFHHLQ